MTTEQATFLEDQIETLDWYRRIVNIALELQRVEVYTRVNAVACSVASSPLNHSNSASPCNMDATVSASSSSMTRST